MGRDQISKNLKQKKYTLLYQKENQKDLIDIQVVEKEKECETLSHPEQLLNAALQVAGRIDKEGNPINPDQWEEKSSWDNYKLTDEVWIIFDKDYRGLKAKYGDIVSICEKNKINMGVTNPNFEFWLLLHYKEVLGLDRDLLKTNPKNVGKKYFENASKSKKYIEILLSQYADGYKKGGSNFEKFVDKIELAISNEKEFEESVEKLIDNLGSNIGVLISKMKNS